MIEVYDIELTPSRARRMVRVSEVNDSFLVNDDVRALAKEGIVNPAAISHLGKAERLAVQDLMDFDLRCFLGMGTSASWQSWANWLRPVIMAAKLKGIESFYLDTNYTSGRTVSAEADVLRSHGFDVVASNDLSDSDRHRLIEKRDRVVYLVPIYETVYFPGPLASVFYHTILIGLNRIAMGTELFPKLSVNDIYHRTFEDKAAMGFGGVRKDDLAVLCHVSLALSNGSSPS